MIKRLQQEQITKLLKQFPAVAILGPRQVGKTTLAKLLLKQMNKPAAYIDLEKASDAARLSDAEAYFETMQGKCVIIDEVQRMPHLFAQLRPAIDEYRKPGRFILTGSASTNLIKGVSETLAGRISYVELCPVNISEKPKNISINKHWFRGGFPDALLAKTDAAYHQWMNDFVRSYIERDLPLIFGVEFSMPVMRSFWSMLAHYSGGIWNAESFSRSLGVTGPTISRYIDFLEAAFVVHRLPAYFSNTKKRLVKAPKVYIRDTGLLHHLTHIITMGDLPGNPIVGASWEGYVVEQIKQLKHNNIQLFYYRTHAGAECDVVLVKGIKPLACIEIKLSKTPAVSKGFYQTIEDLKPQHKFIITPGNDGYPVKDGILVRGLTKFISEDLPTIK